MGGIFGGGGGGGGGTQTSKSEASYPAEFRPLAESARKQIEALQAALPLVSHAGFQPAGVAGLSPVEQFTINELAMRAPYLPATFASLMELPEPVGAASQGAVRAGQGSRGAAGALDYLSDFLGRDVRPAPAAPLSFPTMTRWPVPETAFPGLSRAALEAARPGIATQPVPYAQPMPSAPSPPPPPVPLPPPPGSGAGDAGAARAVAETAVAQMSLTPYGFQYYEALVARGVAPNDALQLARNEELQVNPPNPSPGGGD